MGLTLWPNPKKREFLGGLGVLGGYNPSSLYVGN